MDNSLVSPDAIADARVMSPGERNVRHLLNYVTLASVPAAIGLAWWLGGDAASNAITAEGTKIAGDPGHLQEAIKRATEWGIQAGPDTLKLYLDQVGTNAANVTRAVTTGTEVAFVAAAQLVKAVLSHRVKP